MHTFAAQSESSAVGSALRSGRRGRAFESPLSDRAGAVLADCSSFLCPKVCRLWRGMRSLCPKKVQAGKLFALACTFFYTFMYTFFYTFSYTVCCTFTYTVFCTFSCTFSCPLQRAHARKLVEIAVEGLFARETGLLRDDRDFGGSRALGQSFLACSILKPLMYSEKDMPFVWLI